MAENQLERIMQGLKCSEEEARAIMAYDKAIDQGKRGEFDLDPEREKMAKKLANAGTRKAPTVFKFEPRQRKENPTKQAIITEIATFLQQNSENACENVEITNKERQIAFKIGENAYELTLVQKRKPKK